MRLVDVAPERVLETVGAVEYARDQPSRDLVDGVKKHLLALAVHVEALLDELIIIDDIFIQCPGVFGKPESRERTLLLGEVDRINRRVPDRHRGVFWVNIDGRHIEAELPGR